MHWCEQIRMNKFVRTPVNTYTALAFIFGGYGVLVLAFMPPSGSSPLLNGTPPQNHLREYQLFNLLQAITLIWGGIGSFWNHAATTHFSREPDRASVWSLTILPVVFATLRFVCVPAPDSTYAKSTAIVVGANVVAAVGHLFFGDSPLATPLVYAGTPIVAVSLVGVLCSRSRLQQRWNLRPMHSNWKLIYASIISSLLALLLQDPNNIGACYPEGAWFTHTHGFWHVLMATALFLLWLFFWTENQVDEKHDDNEDNLVECA